VVLSRKRLVVWAISLAVLCGVAFGVRWAVWGRSCPGPGVQLLRRARREGFVLPEWEVPMGQGFAQVATQDPPFRDWLVDTVADREEEPAVRLEAYRALDFLEDDGLLKDAFASILDWLEQTKTQGREDGRVRSEVRYNMVIRVLMTNLPDEDLLTIIRRARPERWQQVIRDFAGQHPQEPSGYKEGVHEHMIARAKALVQYLERTEGLQAPPAAPGEGARTSQ
jgi:hypothetical protein